MHTRLPRFRFLCGRGVRRIECTALAAARLKARGMAITGTVPEPRQLSRLWRFIKSLC
jgi:hypothetical protein